MSRVIYGMPVNIGEVSTEELTKVFMDTVTHWKTQYPDNVEKTWVSLHIREDDEL